MNAAVTTAAVLTLAYSPLVYVLWRRHAKARRLRRRPPP